VLRRVRRRRISLDRVPPVQSPNGTAIQSGAVFFSFGRRQQIGAFTIAGSNRCGDAF
jgi:hypothetical protein